MRKRTNTIWLPLLLVGSTLLSGCSVRRFAINRVGDALAGSGTTFSADDDPELVRAAVPFSLKLMEAVLAETPNHEGLLLSAASGFTEYAYAFVEEDADELEARDLAAAEALRIRARKLYLRARDYGLRGLEVRHPAVGAGLRQKPKEAVQNLGVKDVPLLYWTAAAWGSAISLSKDNPDLIAQLPSVEAMMERALALDEAFDAGSLHSFFITYEMSRAGGAGDPAERARRHFDRALELSAGRQAGPWVSWAEAVCVQKQDRKGFRLALGKALAVDVDAKPEWRLVNLVMQRRARWLLGREDELFLKPDDSAK